MAGKTRDVEICEGSTNQYGAGRRAETQIFVEVDRTAMASSCTEIERPLTPLKSSRAELARWVPVAFVAVYILWGSTYIGIRIAIESFPPLAMAAIRHSVVGLILYPILRIKTGIRPTA